MKELKEKMAKRKLPEREQDDALSFIVGLLFRNCPVVFEKFLDARLTLLGAMECADVWCESEGSLFRRITRSATKRGELREIVAAVRARK